MHFEVLTEDRSGGKLVDVVLEKILGGAGPVHSWRVHPYKGLGHIPKNLHKTTDPSKRLLLYRLPTLLRGYGKSTDKRTTAVVVIVDLDDRDCLSFKRELTDVLKACTPAPRALFRIAIKETEAWLLGDQQAVMAAYPCARVGVLNAYPQDGIVGTWEVLADAVHPGGARALKSRGYPATGVAKSDWALRIAPHMDVDRNQSQSFQVFADGVRRLAGL